MSALRLRLAALLAGFVWLSLPAAAEPITAFRLDNGMDVVVIEDHRVDVVTHMVWYRVGAADEPPGKSGIAHFLEHLMFKGTEAVPDAAFSRIVADNGGQDNAFTGQDFTGYFQRIAADRLDLVMGMEADRMVNLRLGLPEVESEREVILEERGQVVESSPMRILGELRSAAMYLNHPYRNPIIGWRHEMEGLTREDALDFYLRHYAPDNAILVVAGAVTPDQVREAAERYFGPIPPRGVAQRERTAEPPHRAARRVAYEDPRVGQPVLIRDWLAPTRRDGQARAAALEALAGVLGDGINSRLQQALVANGGPAVSAGAWYAGDARDYATLTVFASPRPDVSLPELEAALEAVLADFLGSDGPEAHELDRLRSGWRAAEIYERDSQMARARRYGAGLASDLTLEQIESWPAELQAVSAEAVMAAAREVLQPQRSVTAWLTAPQAETPGGPEG